MPAMTSEEFGAQMKRLVKVYGPMAYPDERLTLIYREVADFEVTWLSVQVDLMIGTLRQPPLVEAFAEAAAKERERRWSQARAEEKTAARNFFAGRIELPDEDRQIFFQTIIARVKGEVSDPDWDAFMQTLTQMFGPIDPILPGQPFDRGGMIQRRLPPEMTPEMAERQRKSLPYVDN
jgi:hypothetical protein